MSTSIIGPVTPRQETQERQVQLELASTTSVNTHMHEAQGLRLIGCDQTTTPGVRVPLAAKSGGGGSKEVLVSDARNVSGTTSDQRRGAGSLSAHGNTAETLCPCSPRAATRLPATSGDPRTATVKGTSWIDALCRSPPIRAVPDALLLVYTPKSIESAMA